MIDLHYIDNWPFEHPKWVLNIKYSFRNMPFLVADKYGNLFILPHCPNKRTIPFKILDKSKEYICYHGVRIRLSTLRRRTFKDERKEEVGFIKALYQYS